MTVILSCRNSQIHSFLCSEKITTTGLHFVRPQKRQYFIHKGASLCYLNRTTNMKDEIQSAVDFLTNLLKTNSHLDTNHLDKFNRTLCKMLHSHYQNHWFPEKPFKGSGYRCIRINHKMDPLVAKAGCLSGLNANELFTLFPNELTIWVDPREVSYRIGENGSVGVLTPEIPTSSDVEEHHHDTPSPVPASYNTPSLLTCKDEVLKYFISQPDNHFEYLTSFVSS